jgi:squalene-hopene/tetraprenyl-beta-curcumene cyclase
MKCRWLTSLIIMAAFTQVRAEDNPDQGTGGPPRASSKEPIARVMSLKRSAEFLDAVAVQWTRQHKCGTCHTNYAYLMARPSLKEFASPAVAEVRAFFEGRAAHWDDPAPGAKPRWDTEVVATAWVLAMSDAATTGTLQATTRKALDRMWTVQRPDGSWDWLKCDWPPYEHDDYYGAIVAALGAGYAPGDYARGPSAQAGLDRLRGYFRANPPPDLHHRAMLLWASTRLDGLVDEKQKEATIGSLRSLQQADGGWSLPSLGRWKRHDGTPNDPAAPSDGYGTGFVVFVLRQAGVPAADPAVARGVVWLEANQRESGRWFTRSLSTDKAHYISNAGTAFAVMAIKAAKGPDVAVSLTTSQSPSAR